VNKLKAARMGVMCQSMFKEMLSNFAAW